MYEHDPRVPPPVPPGLTPSSHPVPPGPVAPTDPGPPRSASPWPWLLGVAASVVVLMVLVAAGVVGVQLLRGGQGTASASGSDVAPERPAPPPSPAAPSPTAAPDDPAEDPAEDPADGPVHPETGPDGPEGPVAGPTFGEDEETYLMEFGEAAQMPFDFRTPPGWGCAGGDANPDAVRQVCLYDGGTFPIVEGGPGGIIEVQPCPDPCGEDEWRELRELFPDPESPWQRIDDTTRYAETDVIETEDGPKVGVRMSRLFSVGGGDPDTHVTVRMSGHPEELPPLQKIINEIYVVTS